MCCVSVQRKAAVSGHDGFCSCGLVTLQVGLNIESQRSSNSYLIISPAEAKLISKSWQAFWNLTRAQFLYPNIIIVSPVLFVLQV